jgi:hypothetical protein
MPARNGGTAPLLRRARPWTLGPAARGGWVVITAARESRSALASHDDAAVRQRRVDAPLVDSTCPTSPPYDNTAERESRDYCEGGRTLVVGDKNIAVAVVVEVDEQRRHLAAPSGKAICAPPPCISSVILHSKYTGRVKATSESKRGAFDSEVAFDFRAGG